MEAGGSSEVAVRNACGIEDGLKEDQESKEITGQLESLTLDESNSSRVILCDLGFGIPKEARPRREKILAISNQIVNFLSWQHQEGKPNPVHLKVVDCIDADVEADLRSRMAEIWKTKHSDLRPFPDNFGFSTQPLEEVKANIIYLSPDAPETINQSHYEMIPVVGMLIDRRIQVDRSLNRANKLSAHSVRLPLDEFNLDTNEPLNCDCVLESLQRWYWDAEASNTKADEGIIVRSIHGALVSHIKRHPGRPIHKHAPATSG